MNQLQPLGDDLNGTRPTSTRRLWTVPALVLIVLLGALLRFTGVNWDENQHLHPDERFVTMVETDIRLPGSEEISGDLPQGCSQWGGYLDTQCSPLNPYNRGHNYFVYGTFPLFLVKLVGEWLNQSGYDQIFLVGRYLSGLFDLLTVILIFFIGRRLYNSAAGILAALFVALSVLDIQQSHFFTVDGFANLPVLLAFWFTLDISEGRGGWRSFVLAGAFFGLSVAARINLATFAGIIGLAALLHLIRWLRHTDKEPAMSEHAGGELAGGPAGPEVGRTFAFSADALADQAENQAAASSDAQSQVSRRTVNLGPLAVEIETERQVQESPASAAERAAPTENSLLSALATTIVGLALAAFAALLVFRLAQPYAFTGLVGLNPAWLKDMGQVRDLIAGQVDYPPGHQWANRPDYWFPWINIVAWGLGWPLGLAGSLGILLMGVQLVRRRAWNHLLIFFWVAGLFLYQGQQVGKTMRYFLPIYPFLALAAAYLLVWGWTRARELRSRFSRPGLARLLQLGAVAAALITVGYTLFWAVAFTSIYTRPVSRVAASRWIYSEIPPGSKLGNEHWDDPLPLRVDGKDGFASLYKGIELQMYNEDTPEKRDQIVSWLDQADYIILSSNRLYLSIPRLPLRYPLTTQYYKWLFDGELGFKLEATFTSYPQLFGIQVNDDASEEAFTVYDHPKVLIFKKTADYSHDRLVSLLNTVDLGKVIRQSPLNYTLSHGAFQLSPEDQAADYAGGTWSAIFNPNDLVNRVPALVWLVLLEVLGLVAFPLAFGVWRSFADRGYAFAKALGILVLAWGAWTLAGYHAVPYTRASILAVLLVLLAAGAIAGWKQRADIAAYLKTNWSLVLVEELIFAAFFILSLLIRFGNPDLWHPVFGGEKPMDFAYLNAIIKTTWFPPYNPWFEGGYINYYYFGQVISATLVKLTGIVPEVAYNLLLPTFFALTGLAAFGVAFNLVRAALARRTLTGAAVRQRAIAAGLLAAFLILILGNLGEVGVFGSALLKLGQPFPSHLPGVGGALTLLSGALTWLVDRKPLPLPIGDWYWTATRVIPETINEFPFFTFLYADLHAHLMALAFTLVALSLAVHALFVRARLKWYDLGVIALVLGALRATNTWDYPVYLAIIGAGMAIGYFAEPQGLPVLAGEWPQHLAAYLSLGVLAFAQVLLLVIPTNAAGVKVTLDVLGYLLVLVFALLLGWSLLGRRLDPRPLARLIGWRFIGVVALAVLFYLPFLVTSSYGSGTAYGGIELWQGLRTELGQYLVVHGIFLFLIITFLLVQLLSRAASATGGTRSFWQSEWFTFMLPGFVLFEIALAVLNQRVFAFVLPLVLLGLLIVFRRESAPERRLIGLLIVGGLAMSLMVEYVTLKGDIGRMNTVFKFYLQAWVLFGIASASGLALIGDQLVPARAGGEAPTASGEVEAARSESDPHANPQRIARANSLRRGWWFAFGVLIFCGLGYPVFATWAKVNDRYVADSPPGLNGMAYMQGASYSENNHDFPLAPDYEAIQWLREHVQGSPVLVEGNTGLYRWGDRISINTGLPTIVGWDWHTKQQYSLVDGSLIDRRLEDIRNFYNSADPNLALDLIRLYDVSFIYVGPLERAVYDSEGLSKFDALAASGALSKVYDKDGVLIYQVNGRATALAP